MSNIFKIIGGLFAGWSAYKMYIVNQLKYWTAADFGATLLWLNVGLLDALDRYQGELVLKFGTRGKIIISPASGTLFRSGDDGQHGLGRAADIMFLYLRGEELFDAYLIAKKYFTGVGFAAVWEPFPGLHVDVRVPKRADYVATWGYGRYSDGSLYSNISAQTAIDTMRG